MTISLVCWKRASTTGAAFPPSPRISSIRKRRGRRSRGCKPKPSPAASFCANAWRSIRSLSAGKNFSRLASAIVLQPYPARTDLRVAPGLPPSSDSSMPSAKKLKITALAGGVGASKLLLGLYEVMDPGLLTIIVNTGDDIILHGLKISPDLDIVTYTLAGVVDSAKGWGIRGETFHALKRLAGYGRADWFNLGDRDLATHIHRTAMLAEGKTLSQAADSIRIALRVKRRTEPVVKGIRFAGVESAQPAPGVLEAIRDADRILICPSNPLISIGPILAVPQVRDQLRAHKEKVFAVCPIVGGKSLKGPSDKMLAQLGHQPAALGVAKLYAEFTGTFVIDPADRNQAAPIVALGMKVVILPAIMKTPAQKRKLARALLSLSFPL